MRWTRYQSVTYRKKTYSTVPPPPLIRSLKCLRQSRDKEDVTLIIENISLWKCSISIFVQLSDLAFYTKGIFIR